ncbi:kinetochore and Eb1-associated basic protein isoform X2 [Drosophila persimilis]|uniref:kinetochore and Eb1-associated basic protein isoform X2 n=1 Tax=Drosophila persimilis TaxID=7234 RepID=UPI000F093594|nr:kinetochore and Eb1-associated basic protein isoform X2 [Drosophila persimilis]
MDVPKTSADLLDIPRTPDMRSPGRFALISEPRPLRTKELLERQRQANRTASCSASKVGQQKTPEMRSTTESAIFLEPIPLRTKELLERQRQASSASRAARTPSSACGNMTDRDIPRTPEMRCPSIAVIPCSEPQPVRTKELLERWRRVDERERCHRPASASRIGRQNHKSPIPGITTNRLLVPSIGFSYPKQQLLPHTSTSASPYITKLGITKRRLEFRHDQGKESVGPKLKRLTAYLQHELEGWGSSTEQRLRQMTIADFVSIVRHLLPLSGATVGSMSKACYAEQLIEALQQLKYPKKVNRTWLLMPGTQHVIGHVLDLLDFLLDFAVGTKRDAICVFPFVGDSLDDEKTFVLIARDYHLWQGEENSLQLEQHKRNELLRECCNSNDIAALQQELEALELELKEELKLNTVTDQQQLVQKDRLQQELTNCQDELKSLLAESSDYERKFSHLCTETWRKKKVLQSLQDRVRSQRCSYQDYARLLDLQAERSDELQVYRRRQQDIFERLSIAKLRWKRSRRNLMNSIEAFNVKMRNIEYSLVFKGSCPKSLQLPLYPSMEEIQERLEKLKQWRHLMDSTVAKTGCFRKPLGEIKS